MIAIMITVFFLDTKNTVFENVYFKKIQLYAQALFLLFLQEN